VASNRHLGRIVALQALYEYDFRLRAADPDASIDEIITRNLSMIQKDHRRSRRLLRDLIQGRRLSL
jgi:hypothetical protein